MRRSGVLIAAALIAACTGNSAGDESSESTSAPRSGLTGVVSDGDGPVAGATVRVPGSDRSTTTDETGAFMLTIDEVTRIAAWAEGYFIAATGPHTPGDRIVIELAPVPTTDNPGYEWISAVADAGTAAPAPCASCHSAQGAHLAATLPVDQWLIDSHSGSAVNPRFLSMYTGMDLSGNQSPLTRHAYSRDYGLIPLPPDGSLPYFGPGYRLDFPATTGNCAACHAPAAAIDDPYGIDPTALAGVGAEGVTCDFCHKISTIRLDPQTSLPDAGMPGVLSYEFRRPPADHQFFAGPYDDVAPAADSEDTYLPLYTESAYCAGCHRGVFWDTVVYNSFGEWLSSPYSNSVTGKTCQDCHMPPTGATVFALPAEGGLTRDPRTIPGHRMPGAADAALVRDAVSMTVVATRHGEFIDVSVELRNDGAGHHVPTDSPLRHLLLVVTVTDAAGVPLEQVAGPVIPVWGGVGDPAAGYYSGLPGTAYAKVLEELWTEISPTGAYWNPTRLLSDNRIPAMGQNTTCYSFASPGQGSVRVRVVLLLRRAFVDLMDAKGWRVPDMVMAEETLIVSAP